MSKKNLQVDDITNELQGASLFFKPSTSTPTPLLPASGLPKPQNTATAENQAPEPPALMPEKAPTNNILPNEPINESKNERVNERRKELKNERLKVRKKIHHTFDIFADQLFSLREISLEEEKYTGERVLIGDLAQQALDMFISKYRNKQ